MLVPIALLVASVASASAAPQADEPSSYRPTVRATAQATATIRVISGVRFGEAYPDGNGSGSRRKSLLADAVGNLRDAELLEFQ